MSAVNNANSNGPMRRDREEVNQPHSRQNNSGSNGNNSNPAAVAVSSSASSSGGSLNEQIQRLVESTGRHLKCAVDKNARGESYTDAELLDVLNTIVQLVTFYARGIITARKTAVSACRMVRTLTGVVIKHLRGHHAAYLADPAGFALRQQQQQQEQQTAAVKLPLDRFRDIFATMIVRSHSVSDKADVWFQPRLGGAAASGGGDASQTNGNNTQLNGGGGDSALQQQVASRPSDVFVWFTRTAMEQYHALGGISLEEMVVQFACCAATEVLPSLPERLVAPSESASSTNSAGAFTLPFAVPRSKGGQLAAAAAAAASASKNGPASPLGGAAEIDGTEGASVSPDGCNVLDAPSPIMTVDVPVEGRASLTRLIVLWLRVLAADDIVAASSSGGAMMMMLGGSTGTGIVGVGERHIGPLVASGADKAAFAVALETQFPASKAGAEAAAQAQRAAPSLFPSVGATEQTAAAAGAAYRATRLSLLDSSAADTCNAKRRLLAACVSVTKELFALVFTSYLSASQQQQQQQRSSGAADEEVNRQARERERAAELQRQKHHIRICEQFQPALARIWRCCAAVVPRQELLETTLGFVQWVAEGPALEVLMTVCSNASNAAGVSGAAATASSPPQMGEMGAASPSSPQGAPSTAAELEAAAVAAWVPLALHIVRGLTDGGAMLLLDASSAAAWSDAALIGVLSARLLQDPAASSLHDGSSSSSAGVVDGFAAPAAQQQQQQQHSQQQFKTPFVNRSALAGLAHLSFNPATLHALPSGRLLLKLLASIAQLASRMTIAVDADAQSSSMSFMSAVAAGSDSPARLRVLWFKWFSTLARCKLFSAAVHSTSNDGGSDAASSFVHRFVDDAVDTALRFNQLHIIEGALMFVQHIAAATISSVVPFEEVFVATLLASRLVYAPVDLLYRCAQRCAASTTATTATAALASSSSSPSAAIASALLGGDAARPLRECFALLQCVAGSIIFPARTAATAALSADGGSSSVALVKGASHHGVLATNLEAARRQHHQRCLLIFALSRAFDAAQRRMQHGGFASAPLAAIGSNSRAPLNARLPQMRVADGRDGADEDEHGKHLGVIARSFRAAYFAHVAASPPAVSLVAPPPATATAAAAAPAAASILGGGDAGAFPSSPTVSAASLASKRRRARWERVSAQQDLVASHIAAIIQHDDDEGGDDIEQQMAELLARCGDIATDVSVELGRVAVKLLVDYPQCALSRNASLQLPSSAAAATASTLGHGLQKWFNEFGFESWVRSNSDVTGALPPSTAAPSPAMTPSPAVLAAAKKKGATLLVGAAPSAGTPNIFRSCDVHTAQFYALEVAALLALVAEQSNGIATTASASGNSAVAVVVASCALPWLAMMDVARLFAQHVHTVVNAAAAGVKLERGASINAAAAASASADTAALLLTDLTLLDGFALLQAIKLHAQVAGVNAAALPLQRPLYGFLSPAACANDRQAFQRQLAQLRGACVAGDITASQLAAIGINLMRLRILQAGARPNGGGGGSGATLGTCGGMAAVQLLLSTKLNEAIVPASSDAADSKSGGGGDRDAPSSVGCSFAIGEVVKLFLQRLALRSGHSDDQLRDVLLQLRSAGTPLAMIFVRAAVFAAFTAVVVKCNTQQAGGNRAGGAAAAASAPASPVDCAEFRGHVAFIQAVIDIFSLPSLVRSTYEWYDLCAEGTDPASVLAKAMRDAAAPSPPPSSSSKTAAASKGKKKGRDDDDNDEALSSDAQEQQQTQKQRRDFAVDLDAAVARQYFASVQAVASLFRLWPAMLLQFLRVTGGDAEFLEVVKNSGATAARGKNGAVVVVAAVDGDGGADDADGSSGLLSSSGALKARGNINSDGASVREASIEVSPGLLPALRHLANVPAVYTDDGLLRHVVFCCMDSLLATSGTIRAHAAASAANNAGMPADASALLAMTAACNGAAATDTDEQRFQRPELLPKCIPRLFGAAVCPRHAPVVVGEVYIETAMDVLAAFTCSAPAPAAAASSIAAAAAAAGAVTVSKDHSAALARAFGQRLYCSVTDISSELGGGVMTPFIVAAVLDRTTRRLHFCGPLSAAAWRDTFESQLIVVRTAMQLYNSGLEFAKRKESSTSGGGGGGARRSHADCCAATAAYVLGETFKSANAQAPLCGPLARPASAAMAAPRGLLGSAVSASASSSRRPELHESFFFPEKELVVETVSLALTEAALALVDVLSHQMGCPADPFQKDSSSSGNSGAASSNGAVTAQLSSTAAFGATRPASSIGAAVNPAKYIGAATLSGADAATNFATCFGLLGGGDVSPITGSRKAPTCIALNSLALLIRLLGSHLRLIAPRVPVLLEFALRGFPSDIDVACRVSWVWANLVHVAAAAAVAGGASEAVLGESRAAWLMQLAAAATVIVPLRCDGGSSLAALLLHDAISSLVRAPRACTRRELRAVSALLSPLHPLLRAVFLPIVASRKYRQALVQATAAASVQADSAKSTAASTNSSNKKAAAAAAASAAAPAAKKTPLNLSVSSTELGDFNVKTPICDVLRWVMRHLDRSNGGSNFTPTARRVIIRGLAAFFRQRSARGAPSIHDQVLHCLRTQKLPGCASGGGADSAALEAADSNGGNGGDLGSSDYAKFTVGLSRLLLQSCVEVPCDAALECVGVLGASGGLVYDTRFCFAIDLDLDDDDASGSSSSSSSHSSAENSDDDNDDAASKAKKRATVAAKAQATAAAAKKQQQQQQQQKRQRPETIITVAGGSGADANGGFAADSFVQYHEFGVLLLRQCMQALEGNSDKLQHDAGAYAVQTLMRILANRKRRDEGRHPLVDSKPLAPAELQDQCASWWGQLTAWQQQTFMPFTTCHYTSSSAVNKAAGPFFSPALPFRAWLTFWVGQLAYRAVGLQGAMLMAMRTLARGDVAQAMFLLPHLVCNIITMSEREADVNAVLLEIDAVLSYALEEVALHQRLLAAGVNSSVFSPTTTGGAASSVEESTGAAAAAASAASNTINWSAIPEPLAREMWSVAGANSKRQFKPGQAPVDVPMQVSSAPAAGGGSAAGSTAQQNASYAAICAANRVQRARVFAQQRAFVDGAADEVGALDAAGTQQRGGGGNNNHQAALDVAQHLVAVFHVVDAVDLMITALRSVDARVKRIHTASATTSAAAVAASGDTRCDIEKASFSHDYAAGMRRLNHFLCCVSNTRLAAAALRIGNAARALRYIESDFTLPAIENRGDLHDVFASIGDVDSAKAVFDVCGMSVAAAALAEHRNGAWQESLRLCEVVLQQQQSEHGAGDALVAMSSSALSGSGGGASSASSSFSFEHADVALRNMRELGYYHALERSAAALVERTRRHIASLAQHQPQMQQQQPLAGGSSIKSQFDQFFAMHGGGSSATKRAGGGGGGSNSRAQFATLQERRAQAAKQLAVFERHRSEAAWRIAQWNTDAVLDGSSCNGNGNGASSSLSLAGATDGCAGGGGGSFALLNLTRQLGAATTASSSSLSIAAAAGAAASLASTLSGEAFLRSDDAESIAHAHLSRAMMQIKDAADSVFGISLIRAQLASPSTGLQRQLAAAAAAAPTAATATNVNSKTKGKVDDDQQPQHDDPVSRRNAVLSSFLESACDLSRPAVSCGDIRRHSPLLSLAASVARARAGMTTVLHRPEDSHIKQYADVVTLHVLQDLNIFVDMLRREHDAIETLERNATVPAAAPGRGERNAEVRRAVFAANLLQTLNVRFERADLDDRHAERVLAVHRAMMQALGNDVGVVLTWSAQVKVLRRSGQVDASRHAVLQAIAAAERGLTQHGVRLSELLGVQQQQPAADASSARNRVEDDSDLFAGSASSVVAPGGKYITVAGSGSAASSGLFQTTSGSVTAMLAVPASAASNHADAAGAKQHTNAAVAAPPSVLLAQQQLKQEFWLAKLTETTIRHEQAPAGSGEAEAAADTLHRYVASAADIPGDIRAKMLLTSVQWSHEKRLLGPGQVMARLKDALAYCQRGSEELLHVIALHHDKLASQLRSDQQDWMNRQAQQLSATQQQMQMQQANQQQQQQPQGGVSNAAALALAALAATPSPCPALDSTEQPRQKDAVNALFLHARNAIDHYAKSLQVGVESAYLSLPRLLSTWLDTVTHLQQLCSSGTAHAHKLGGIRSWIAAKIADLDDRIRIRLITGSAGGTPPVSPAIVVAGLSQIISRVGGDAPGSGQYMPPGTNRVLLDLLGHLMKSFREQCLWAFSGCIVDKAAAQGKKRAGDIRDVVLGRPSAPGGGTNSTSFYLEGVRAEKGEAAERRARQYVENCMRIVHCFREICNADHNKINNTTKLTTVPVVRQLITDVLPVTRWILPIQATLTPNLMVALAGKNNGSADNNNNAGGDGNETSAIVVSDGDSPESSKAGGKSGKGGKAGAASSSSAFSSSLPVFPDTPRLAGFDDVCQLMTSLQKPKRIVVRDEAGAQHAFLCKAKDEPRKDARLMELAAMMNMLFANNAETRRRQLELRRYAVTAVTEDCGMIEWMEGVMTMRRIVDDLHAVHGTGLKQQQIKTLSDRVEKGTIRAVDMMRSMILPHFPPVLHLWFHARTQHPPSWYEMRRRYTNALAVWSIFGHMLGLGDRHTENLMLDNRTGEIAHVDFACMFDKGETLQVPERVRFRMTQNCVAALGVTGTAGAFTKVCELTTEVHMKHKDMIMGLIEAFLHDPLVEWAKTSSRSGGGGGSGPEPKKLIARVAKRLDGFTDLFTDNNPEQRPAAASGGAASAAAATDVHQNVVPVPLSVQGQVRALIENTTSIENLAKMYIWWMAWL